MGCETFKLDDGTHVIVCSRGATRAGGPCAVCKKPSSRLCDYVVAAASSPTKRGTPRRKAKTCDAKLCAACAIRVGDDRDLCQHHARVVKAAETPPAMLADPSPFAMQVVADHVEERTTVSERPEPPADRERREILDRSYLADPRDQRLDVGEFGHTFLCTFEPRDRADWQEYFTERAAIAEYVGGLPRAAAEVIARQCAGKMPRHDGHGPLFDRRA